MTTATTPRQPAKRAKGRARFTAKELWSIGAEARRKAPNAPPFVEWERLFEYNKQGWQAVADYVNSIGIAAPRKERKQP